MQFDQNEDRLEKAKIVIRQTMTMTFGALMHDTGLPPMTVMRLLACSVGTLYREISDAHLRDGNCPCGWWPCMQSDIETLQSDVAFGADQAPTIDLWQLATVGRA